MAGLVCSFPVEYCEFGSSFSKCKEWLRESNSELFNKYYSEGGPHIISYLSYALTVSDALQAKLGTMSMEAQTKLEKDAAEKEAKAEAKADEIGRAHV